MKLAEILKIAREHRNLSLAEAAKGIGISASHLHAMETGKKPRPKMEILNKLSLFYGLNYDNLCISAIRIPQDAFFKVIRNPELLVTIRAFKE